MLEGPSERIDLHETFRLLRRGWLLIVACMVLLGAGAMAHALSQPKEYTAGASLLFRDPEFDQKLFGSTFISGSRDADRAAATNVALVGMTEVAARTAARNQINLSPKEVQRAVIVEPDGRSDVVNVKATLDSSGAAATVANAFATEFIELRRESDQKTIFNALKLVEQQIADLREQGTAGSDEGNSLRSRAQQLSVLGSLQTGNAELVQRAEPPSGASAPRPKRNAAIGLFLGGLLGIGLSFLRERLDRRLRSVESLSEAFGKPVLARVPVANTIRRGLASPRSLADEAFSTLWTNLRYFNVSRGIQSVLVTSPTSGDGKSTVALNLAAAAARSGSRVLLIEADLRRPSLARAVAAALPPGGLTQVLAGVMPFEPALHTLPTISGTGSVGNDRQFDILFAGPIPPNPAEMLDSDGMRQLITDAQARYDVVVIDTPPLLVVPDAVPLLGQVSAVLAVGRLGATTRDSVAELTSKLSILDAPLVGVVANYATETGGGYYYYYGDEDHDPAGRADEAPTVASAAHG